jgi:hypothetical protein
MWGKSERSAHPCRIWSKRTESRDRNFDNGPSLGDLEEGR